METFILQIFRVKGANKQHPSRGQEPLPSPKVQRSRAGCWSRGWGLPMRSAVLRATPQAEIWAGAGAGRWQGAEWSSKREAGSCRGPASVLLTSIPGASRWPPPPSHGSIAAGAKACYPCCPPNPALALVECSRPKGPRCVSNSEHRMEC